MKNVLNIMPTDHAKATGFRMGDTGPDNKNFVMYLPSKNCDMALSFGQTHSIFGGTIQLLTFDYITIHDGDYSESAVSALILCFHHCLHFAEDARINKPASMRYV